MDYFELKMDMGGNGFDWISRYNYEDGCVEVISKNHDTGEEETIGSFSADPTYEISLQEFINFLTATQKAVNISFEMQRDRNL